MFEYKYTFFILLIAKFCLTYIIFISYRDTYYSSALSTAKKIAKTLDYVETSFKSHRRETTNS